MVRSEDILIYLSIYNEGSFIPVVYIVYFVSLKLKLIITSQFLKTVVQVREQRLLLVGSVFR